MSEQAAEIEMSECCTCHYKWPKGMDGNHSCSEQLTKELTRITEIALQLEKRVVWAIKFMKCPGAGMVVHRTEDGGFGTSQHWTEWFADAAEMLGRYKVDRELIGLSQREVDKILKQRAAAEKGKTK